MLIQTNQVKPLTLTGRSGRSYPFSIYPFHAVWNSVGVVYAVLREEPGRLVLLYVGQTGDLMQRFSNHHLALDFALLRATQLAVLSADNESVRCTIEADLVGNYNPPLNKTNHG